MAPLGQYLCVLTGTGAFFCAWRWQTANFLVSAALVATGIATCAQHLTEGSQPIVSKVLLLDGGLWKYIDRACALTTALIILCACMPVRDEVIEAGLLLALLLFCDAEVLVYQYASLVHSVWHVGIFWFLFRLAVRLSRNEGAVPRRRSRESCSSRATCAPKFGGGRDADHGCAVQRSEALKL